MPTELQLKESIRLLADDRPGSYVSGSGIADDVFRGLRARRRRRVVAGAAAAVAAVTVASYAGVHAVGNSAATPAIDQTSDGEPAGHSVLPPEALELRGEAVGEALSLPRVSEASVGCAGTVAAFAPGHGFCVDLGNAPDDWLVTELITESDRSSAPLRSVRIAWESSLPAPPPVVVEFLRAKLATLADTYGEHSAQYNRAKVNLDMAQALWDDKAGWIAAGWNDRYWGDPWWPASDEVESQTGPIGEFN